MSIQFEPITITTILIRRSDRQRKDLGDLASLADSIRRLGLINPITVTYGKTLIAGERRLEACRSLGWASIPARFYEELNKQQLQLVELEENVKRLDIDWRDQAMSVQRIHEIYKSQDPTWTLAKTGDSIGVSASSVSDSCLVASRLFAHDERIINAPTLTVAKNIIARENERGIDNELNSLLETVREEKPSVIHSSNSSGATQVESEALPPPKEESVIAVDFLQWLKQYSGRRFNLLHCDFPYGIGHDNSEQGGTALGGKYASYEDSEETYWKLCAALVGNTERLLTASAHVMFWFSMKYYSETVKFFQENSDLTLVMEQPLIWHKSDGKGIVSDSNRRPRNVYETALLFSRGDRKILSPVDNCYSCPTQKSRALHVSEKPEPMLRHFFRMFIDGYSEVLDPTCGAGSALRAAEALGAKRVLGLELNADFALEASSALTRARNLSTLSDQLEE